MANVSNLYNSAVQSSDPEKVLRGPDAPLQVGSVGYAIPVPWLRCFRKADFQPVNFSVGHSEGPETTETILMPWVSVEEARENVRDSLPVFESIAGDARLGRAYWLHALSVLESLPLPYLALDYTEIWCMGVGDCIGSALAATGPPEVALPHLLELSGFEQGARPYHPDVFWVISQCPDESRRRSSKALHMHPGLSWFYQKTESPPPGPRVLLSGDSLESVLKDIGELLDTRYKEASTEFRFETRSTGKFKEVRRLVLGPNKKFIAKTVQEPEPPQMIEPGRLGLKISLRSKADRDTLANDGTLLSQLDQLYARIDRLCQEYGHVWVGSKIA
jgi:hypothetical protein